MSTRVYRYGLLSPLENAEIIAEQMRLAHVYRNELTAIELARRASVREAMSSFSFIEAMQEAEKKLAEEVTRLTKEIKAQRSKTRKKSETQEARDRLKEALATLPSFTKGIVDKSISVLYDLKHGRKRVARAFQGSMI